MAITFALHHRQNKNTIQVGVPSTSTSNCTTSTPADHDADDYYSYDAAAALPSSTAISNTTSVITAATTNASNYTSTSTSKSFKRTKRIKCSTRRVLSSCFDLPQQVIVLIFIIPALFLLLNTYFLFRHLSLDLDEEGYGSVVSYYQMSNDHYHSMYSCQQEGRDREQQQEEEEEEGQPGRVHHREDEQEEEQVAKIDSRRLFAGDIVHDKCFGEGSLILEFTDLIVEVVLAYCDADISWIRQDVIGAIANSDDVHSNVTIRMTILSKCGKELNDISQDIREDQRISEIDFINLANVGGCDYAYAYYINHCLKKREYYHVQDDKEDGFSSLVVLLFIKDTPRDMTHFGMGDKGTYVSVSDMIHLASKGEFACGSKTQCNISPYHDVPMLNSWMMHDYIRISSRNATNSSQFNSTTNGDASANNSTRRSNETGTLFNIYGYKNLQDFHTRALHWRFPNKNITLVCYGGTFAINLYAFMENLNGQSEIQKTFSLIEKALDRSSEPTIEEHFMERTWAGLLSKPLNAEYTGALKMLQNESLPVNISTSIFGAIKSGNIEKTCNSTEWMKFKRTGIRRKIMRKRHKILLDSRVKILTKEEILLRTKRAKKVSSEQMRRYKKRSLIGGTANTPPRRSNKQVQ